MRIRRPRISAEFGRRSLLRGGVATAALLSVGGVLALETRGYFVPPATQKKLRSLSAKEFLIVEALVERMMRPDAADFPSPKELGCAFRIDALVAKLDHANRNDFSQLLHVVEHALPWTIGRASRFTRLAGHDQDAVLASMMQSHIGLLRGAFDVLKSLCAMSYFSDAQSWGAIGYDGPLVNRPENGWISASSLTRQK